MLKSREDAIREQANRDEMMIDEGNRNNDEEEKEEAKDPDSPGAHDRR